MEQDEEMVMDLLDDYEDGELMMSELYHGLKEKNQGTLAKCISVLCNQSKDCDKENMRNIELCDALCRNK